MSITITKFEASIIDDIRRRHPKRRPSKWVPRLWRPQSHQLAACHRLQAKGVLRQERNGVRRITALGLSHNLRITP